MGRQREAWGEGGNPEDMAERPCTLHVSALPAQIQDVKPGSSITGKPNSIQLKTATGGSVCYITDSETELVEWMSAIEGEVQRICRHAAGALRFRVLGVWNPAPRVAGRGHMGPS
jgi:hypothetical protein